MLFKEMDFSFLRVLKQHCLGLDAWKGFWGEFEWENKVLIKSFEVSVSAFLERVLKECGFFNICQKGVNRHLWGI